MNLAKARQMLSEIYNWVTEGFATADLRDAKALPETLGGNGEKGKWGNG
jgi:adenylate cyclase